MTTGILVEEVMTTNVLCAEPGVKIIDCAKLMTQKKVGSIVVCTEDDEVVGILTEQDLTRNVMARDIDPNATLITQVVPKKIITITPEKDLSDAMIMMQQHHIKHLPVVNENGRLEGILSFNDILHVQPGLGEIADFKQHLTEEEQRMVFSAESLA